MFAASLAGKSRWRIGVEKDRVGNARIDRALPLHWAICTRRTLRFRALHLDQGLFRHFLHQQNRNRTGLKFVCPRWKEDLFLCVRTASQELVPGQISGQTLRNCRRTPYREIPLDRAALPVAKISECLFLQNTHECKLSATQSHDITCLCVHKSPASPL